MDNSKKPVRTMSITQEQAQQCIDALFRIGNVSVRLRTMRNENSVEGSEKEIADAMKYTIDVLEPVKHLDLQGRPQQKIDSFPDFRQALMLLPLADPGGLVYAVILELFETKKILMSLGEQYMML